MREKSKILEIKVRKNSHDKCYFSFTLDLDDNGFYTIKDETDPKKSNHHSNLLINKKGLFVTID